MGEAGGPGRDEGVDQAGQEVEGVAREGHQEEGGPGGEEALGGEGGVHPGPVGHTHHPSTAPGRHLGGGQDI